MSILRNKTQGDFTIIQNTIIRDYRTSAKERGLFLTLCSLPDNWNFSEDGMAKIMKDGKDAIHGILMELEGHGYIKRYKTKDSHGRFESIVQIYPEGDAPNDTDDDYTNTTSEPSEKNGFTVTENPSRSTQHGDTATDKQPQYNTINKSNKSKTNNQECVEIVHTLGNQSLSKTDYDDLVRQFGKNNVDYQIQRILSKPYRGMLRKDIIAEWCLESLEADKRKISGCSCPNSPDSAQSFSNHTHYDFNALNKFIQDN